MNKVREIIDIKYWNGNRVLSKLLELKELVGLDNVSFETRWMEYTDDKEPIIEYYRPETNAEAEARIQKERAEQARRVAYRKSEYEKLKEEFGNEN